MLQEQVNYAKLSYKYRQHHERYKRLVENKYQYLICQDCHGEGGETDRILEDGSGPWWDCGWCEGTGLLTPHRRGLWLKWKREAKALKNK